MGAEFKQQIHQRLEMLYHRIEELREQQKAIEKQIRDYLQLARYYLDVYEDKHGLDMEGQVEPEMIKEFEAIKVEEVDKRIEEQDKRVHQAVREVLFESNKPLHAISIAMAVVRKYPYFAERMKYVKKEVIVALVSGVDKDLYEKVGRNIYQLK